MSRTLAFTADALLMAASWPLFAAWKSASLLLKGRSTNDNSSGRGKDCNRLSSSTIPPPCSSSC
eukprot:4718140-Prorocentrum_lima.AAC.1